ncbi:hypothetical protein GGI11_004290 [Coemansia sp. RSA 2049]|nr:hypothetical protein GGI11_004290 [Coemansia sp. RSA 2049]
MNIFRGKHRNSADEANHSGVSMGNGLAVDSRNSSGAYGSRGSFESHHAPLHPSMQARGPLVPSSGHAELNPVTAWGTIAGSSGSSTRQAPDMHRSPPPSRGDRNGRIQRSQTAEGAVAHDSYRTPSTAHRPSISTVLSANALHISGGAPFAPMEYENARSSTAPRVRARNETANETPYSRRFSHAEVDSPSNHPASPFGFDTLSSRPTIEDPSIYAHTPGRDSMLAAMHVMGRNPLYSAGAGHRPMPATQDNALAAPNSPTLSHRGSAGSRHHSRVNSLVSPTTRARRIEDTQNALTSGRRASTMGGHFVQHAAEGMPHRPQATQTWYGAGAGASDALSDSFAWGTPSAGAGRMRAGSFAISNVSASARQSFHEQSQRQVRGNGLATEAATRHIHRASYASSAQGSYGASVVGSSHNPHRGGRQSATNISGDAGSSFVSASARKVRHRSTQSKSAAKAPIRSNWYHKEEMLSDSDIRDQEFFSSDEEDFDKEGKRYTGDMVAQQKLIQKQQRTIFDINMRYKMLASAMNENTKEPYEALVDNFGRTCASNRRANREIVLLREEVQGLKAHCAHLEEAAANPPPCTQSHGMSKHEHEMVEQLKRELEDAHRALEVEAMVTRQKQSMLDELNSRNSELQEQMTRIESSAALYYRTALNSNSSSANISPSNSNGKHGEDVRTAHINHTAYGLDADDAAVADTDASYRMRAGTATTTSETLTLRALSDGSAGLDDQHRGSANANSSIADSQERARLESVIGVLKAEKNRCEGDLKLSEVKRVQLEEELKQTKKRMREYEEQRRTLQLEMKHSLSSSIIAGGKNSKDEIAQLLDENEALKDECDSLNRQLDGARDEIRAHTETALAAVGSLDLDSDDDMGGSASQRAEIAKLKLECEDSRQQVKMFEEQVSGLTEELEKTRDQLHRLSHDMLRPYLRESTVAPTMAESVYDQIRQWSELKVVVPPANSSGNEDQVTPTKSSGARNSFRPGLRRFGSLHSDTTASPPLPPPMFSRFNTAGSLGYSARAGGSIGSFSKGNSAKPAGNARAPLPSYSME